MDAQTITQYIRVKDVEFSALSGRQVYQSLLAKEYVEIEELKDAIFKKRMDYFILAGRLQKRRERESRTKQLKKYLVQELGMEDDEAGIAAKKYNKASRTLNKFHMVVGNVAKCSNIDIRDLNLNQIQLAVNENWVFRHSASLGGLKRKAGDADNGFGDIDWGNVDASFQQLRSFDWYKKAKQSPSEMAYVMDVVGARSVQDALYTSRQ